MSSFNTPQHCWQPPRAFDFTLVKRTDEKRAPFERLPRSQTSQSLLADLGSMAYVQVTETSRGYPVKVDCICFWEVIDEGSIIPLFVSFITCWDASAVGGHHSSPSLLLNRRFDASLPYERFPRARSTERASAHNLILECSSLQSAACLALTHTFRVSTVEQRTWKAVNNAYPEQYSHSSARSHKDCKAFYPSLCRSKRCLSLFGSRPDPKLRKRRQCKDNYCQQRHLSRAPLNRAYSCRKCSRVC